MHDEANGGPNASECTANASRPPADLDATQVHCPNVIPLQSGSFVCLFLYIITSTRKIKPE